MILDMEHRRGLSIDEYEHWLYSAIMPDREYRLTVRMSEAEGEMLKQIAEHEGLTASDVVRMHVRRRHAEMFGQLKSKQSKKPTRKGR
jgi:hypothetical protein